MAVGNVDAVARDVDVVEKVLEHPAVIALQPVGGQAVVFVQVERHHVRQIELAAAVQADQLAIDAHRRAAGRQPQHGPPALGLPLVNDRGDHLRQFASQGLMRLEGVAGNFSSGEREAGVRSHGSEM